MSGPFTTLAPTPFTEATITLLALLLVIGLLLLSVAGVVLTFGPLSLAMLGSSLGKADAIYSVTGMVLCVLAFWGWSEWSRTSTLSVWEWILAALRTIAGVIVFALIQQGMESAKARITNDRIHTGNQDH
ncbi:hypothetical protein [Paenarthrobacter sp. NPDC058040]|uniref:hypothetical protein n=1 Tax=unclassified Paenarthrobacter TaxID=2634190 RepID=UPI0036D8A07D